MLLSGSTGGVWDLPKVRQTRCAGSRPGVPQGSLHSALPRGPSSGVGSDGDRYRSLHARLFESHVFGVAYVGDLRPFFQNSTSSEVAFSLFCSAADLLPHAKPSR